MHLMHVLLSAVVRVKWTMSEPIIVEEQEGVTLELSGEAFGVYAYPISWSVGVVCGEAVATNAEAGMHSLNFPVWIPLG